MANEAFMREAVTHAGIQAIRPAQQQPLPLHWLKPAGEEGLYASWQQVCPT